MSRVYRGQKQDVKTAGVLTYGTMRYKRINARFKSYVLVFVLALISVTTMSGCGPTWGYYVSCGDCKPTWQPVEECELINPLGSVQVIAMSTLSPEEIVVKLEVRNSCQDTLLYLTQTIDILTAEIPFDLQLYDTARTRYEPAPDSLLIGPSGEASLSITLSCASVPKSGDFCISCGTLTDMSGARSSDLGLASIDVRRYVVRRY